jgi:hypothetical protein
MEEKLQEYQIHLNYLLDEIFQASIYLYPDPSQCENYEIIIKLRGNLEEQYRDGKDPDEIMNLAILLMKKTREIHTEIIAEAEKQQPVNKQVIDSCFNWFYPVMTLLENRVETDPHFKQIFVLLKQQIEEFQLENHSMKNVEYAKQLRDYTRQLSGLIQNVELEPEKCGICRDGSTESLMKLMPCKHNYHYNCLNEWFWHATLRLSTYSFTMVCPFCGEIIDFMTPT